MSAAKLKICEVEFQTAREMRVTYNEIRVTPLATLVGAEISGVDLAIPPGGAELAEIRRALGEYGVVFFREQQLTPEQHIAFARSFGAIDVNPFFATVPGYPMIAEVREEPERQRNIGNGWHTDHSYDEAPALGSMLYARASMYADYEALSDVPKSTVKGHKPLHSSRHVFGPGHVSEPGRDWGGVIARRASRDEATRSEEC